MLPGTILLRNPLLHCSRSKAPSQRHFLHQVFRGVAEAHLQATEGPLGTMRCPHDFGTAVSTAVLPPSQQESLFFCSPEKLSQTYQKLKIRMWRHYALQITYTFRGNAPIYPPAQGCTWDRAEATILHLRDRRNPFPACYWCLAQ